ncbi:MAG: hypothetical protein ACO1RX_16025 [Candidatus Sericytochromatia bacterium]
MEDPWGLPLREPSLSLHVEAADNPTLATRFDTELRALLPRERFVRMVAPHDAAPQLQIQLRQHRQEMPVGGTFWAPQLPALPRTRMEIELEARLVNGGGEGFHTILVQRGDALAQDLDTLEKQLLESLRQSLIQALQPRYRYR